MARPPFDERMAFLNAPVTTNVFGEPVDAPSLDDVAVGWFVAHGTERYGYGTDQEVDAESGANVGKYKAGAVVDVYERDGRTFVTVVEDRMVGGKLVVRRYDWPVVELNPERCHPVNAIGRHGAAKKLLRAAAETPLWDFAKDRDDFLVGGALRLTDPERELRAGEAKAS